MQTRLQKWGNSLAVRIPKYFAVEAGLSADSAIQMMVKDGNLVISAVSYPDFSLEELLARVTSQNLHTETDTGPVQGNESW
jgi:antitoxin MazE